MSLSSLIVSVLAIHANAFVMAPGALPGVDSKGDGGPSVTLSTPAPDPFNQSPFTVTATFSEPVFGLTGEDFLVNNGTAVLVLGVDGDSVYTVAVTPGGDGFVTVSLNAGAAQNGAAEPSLASGFLIHTFDGTPPEVEVSTFGPNPTPFSVIPVSLVFDEAVYGVGVDDLDITNGTAVQTGGEDGGVSYAFDVTVQSEGIVSITFLAGGAQDAAGNGNVVSAPLDVVYDATRPSGTLSTTASDPTSNTPVPITLSFSEPVFDLTAGDLVLENAEVSEITGGGDTYIASLVPPRDGIITVSLAEGAVLDAAGNASHASAEFAIVFDTQAPAVFNVLRNGPFVTNADTVDFTVTFSEPVTGIDLSDFALNTIAKELTGAQLGSVIGVDDVYIVSVETGDGQGMLGVDVLADGTIRDPADRTLAAAFTLGQRYSVDKIIPVANIGSTASDPTSATLITVTVNFSEPVFGFSPAGLAITNATVQEFGGLGPSYGFDLLPDGPGAVTVSVNEGAATDAAGNACAASDVLSRTYQPEGACDTPEHVADQDGDHTINISELLRVIQFYNSGVFHCDAGSEDGYAVGAGEQTCCPHDSDYTPQDWGINLSELLRLIQFFNGGGYYYCPEAETEDGYCPGQAP